MIGIDTVKISRIERLKERFGDKALKRFLDVDEIKLASSSTSHAGYWAAKEAISKALGVGISAKCGFFDIKLHKDNKNAPYFTLSKHIVEEFKITDTALSITHDGEYAVAVAVIESNLKREKNLYH
ncbi:MAG TPA: holo-ACP synthase [Sulfurospirillum arcachonense]|nr:holo-ACP synthase [Sulfurospirillum arcachonense]HIP45420.1 holo-ACP synthase [Sulfurospirillum arcachonense]